jgi:hypothetical protein|tara:strand:- start:37 stop:258 length:222 start_codon:yes stop_codon:yes gene_type:complete
MKFKFLDEDIALEITRVFAELSDEELKETLDEINYLGQTSRTIRKINVLNKFEPKIKKVKPKLRLIKNEEKTK